MPLVKAAETSRNMPIEIFHKLGNLGYLCPGYPDKYGGGGLGKVGDCILIEQLSYACAGIAAAIMVQGGLATYALMNYGTEKQKKQFLIPALKGDKIAAYALTENLMQVQMLVLLKLQATRDGKFLLYLMN